MRRWIGRWAAGGAVLWLASGSALADRKCVIEAKAATPFTVEVTPKGAARIGVHLTGVPLTITPSPQGQAARVRVRGALEFDATVAPELLPVRTAAEAGATNAMIRLARDTGGFPGGLVLGRPQRDQIFVEVRLGEARLRGLSLPCSSLTLDEVAAPEMQAPSDEGDERFMAAKKIVHLRGFPNKGSTVELELGEHLDVIDFVRSQSEGAWWRVSHTWMDGTSVDGWVERSELAPLKRGALRDTPTPEPPPITCSRAPAVRGEERLGKATIAAGTKVYAARGVGAWATVRSTEPFMVRYLARDEWVEIVTAPGLVSAADCPQRSTVLEDAWVPRAAVKLIGAPAATPAAAEIAPQ